jgi:cytochrome c peroxidase
MLRFVSLLVGMSTALFLVSGCYTDTIEILDSEVTLKVPSHFPDVPFPDDNQWSWERWKLGKRMFFDPIMSADGSVSCASCHNPELAFSDNVDVSLGFDGLEGRSNAPTLTNIAYHPYYTRAGGVPTLEMQVLVPIQEHDEFNTNILLIAERMSQDADYVESSERLYGRSIDPYVITRSIAAYERSLLSGESDYDKYLRGNSGALNEEEKAGMSLFMSERLSCSECHGGFNLTNYAFENNGLYEDYQSLGRKRLTGLDEDLARFKVPTLRNLELTSPYMHDGSLEEIDDVIEHYNSGGKDHVNKSHLIKPLNLSEKEKGQLKAFLLTLTDWNFAYNSILNNK